MKSKKLKTKNGFSFSKYIWRYKWRFGLYILGLILYYISQIVSTLLVAKALEFISLGGYRMTLAYMGYSSLSLVVGKLMMYLSDCMYAKLIRDVATDIKRDMTERVFRISSKSFGETPAGTFVNRIAYSPNEAIYTITDVVDTFGGIFASLVTIIYIMFLNVWIGLIMAVSLVLLFIYEYIKVRLYTKNRKVRKKAEDDVTSFTGEIIRSEKDIKSLNLEDKLRVESNKVYDSHKKAQYKEYMVDMSMWSIRNILIYGLIFLIILTSVYLMEGAFLTASAFIFIFMNSSGLNTVIWQLGYMITRIADIRVEKFRISQVFDERVFPTEKFGDKDIEINGKITFRHVYFGYEDMDFEDGLSVDRDIMANRKKRKEFLKKQEAMYNQKKENKTMVIQNMSITIPKNKTVAFVGRSGSGKSTILSLIPKLYECDRGEVLIDGVNVKELSKESLRGNISLVNQFPYIFNASIKENLLMANQNATDDMIKDALKKASLLEFIEGLSRGIDTVVGENGVKLSGGQKQRLAIARALLKDSKIILFDESTSSLDNFAQEDVRKSIEALQGGKTVVIVAHRLSTIKNVDIIFFLDKGKIIDKGSFNELYNRNKLFKNMFIVENISNENQ